VLEQKLVSGGLLTREGLQQASEHQKRFGCPLEDSLIALRLVSERDVLRVLAREYSLQYLTMEKVAQIRVESELLEKVPVRLAESCGVVPFRFDVDDVLWLIARGPLAPEDREKIRVRSEARQVNLLLARASVVGACIRRHYYSDLQAMDAVARLEFHPPQPAASRSDPEDAQDIVTLSKELKCPACGAPASLDDFQCGKCLLLLNPEAGQSDPKAEVSLVRALLSVTESRPFLKIPDPPPRDISGDATRVVAAPLDRKLVPRLVANLDLALTPMHQFEAYVASHIDGELSIEELIASVRLPRAEIHALLHSFKARGIIELEPPRPATPPPPRAATAAPAPPPVAPRPERHTPMRTPAAPQPPPRTPARGSPTPAAPSYPTPAPGTMRVLNRADAQKVQTSPPRQDQANSVLATAVSMERRGDLNGAIYVLKRGISQLPKPGPLYNKLALILVHQRRDLRQAEELLHKALELEPDNEVYEKNLYKVVTLAALKNT